MTYDEITNRFALQLSPGARQLYAAIFDACATPGRAAYISSWHLAEQHPQFAGLDVQVGSPPDAAKQELITTGLIQEVPNLGCRYQPTGQAWAYHYQAAVARATSPGAPAAGGGAEAAKVGDHTTTEQAEHAGPTLAGMATDASLPTAVSERAVAGPPARYAFWVEGRIHDDGFGMFGGEQHVEQCVLVAEQNEDVALQAALDMLRMRYPNAQWERSAYPLTASFLYEISEAELMRQLGAEIAPRLPGFDDLVPVAAAGATSAAA